MKVSKSDVDDIPSGQHGHEIGSSVPSTEIPPPQPDPAVQETSFAADARSELAVLDHEPVPEEEEEQTNPLALHPLPNYGGISSSSTTENGSSSPPQTSDVTNLAKGSPPRKSQSRSIPLDLLRGLLVAIMALDHNVMALKSWPHETALPAHGESDSGVPVTEWNHPLAYTIRTLTHLCAPGFTFLLGVGIVYFGRSRSLLGWTSREMLRHFAVRGFALIAVSVVMGLVLTRGKIWLLNIVLVMLGVDYFWSGVIFVMTKETEKVLAFLALKCLPSGSEKQNRGKPRSQIVCEGECEGEDGCAGDDTSGTDGERGRGRDTQPLLCPRPPPAVDEETLGGGGIAIAPDRKIIQAADISWYLHNLVLLGLALVTIWWNVWLSPTGGGCHPPTFTNTSIPTSSSIDTSSSTTSITVNSTATTVIIQDPFEQPQSGSNWKEAIFFKIWFYSIQTTHILSIYPPLAWISFSLLGLLYGRIILARPWSSKAIATGNALGGVAFVSVFISTRLFRVGNLSEGCLQMPEHSPPPHVGPDPGPGQQQLNQYLASVPSFLYLVKYPPDVAFWSFTMAVNFFILSVLSIIPSHLAVRYLGKILVVFGTSALFFYVLHLPLLFLFADAVFIPLLGRETNFMDPGQGQGQGQKAAAVGVDAPWAFFLNWLVVLGVLYPACRWYGNFKKGKGVDSLWRFF